MSYLALYRKYRPTNFDDVSGQREIIRVIKNSIENNKVSHAYLFSGPRGTGKTTTAKIIAKMVNCEHLENGKICGKCNSCLAIDNNDIIEIDAASNNGVDEIREIRDKVNLVPTNCKYKIYIIDEVHMLTTQAFNALLKTLEEPPSHIIFILATTEYYKIPLTILSRCQRFQFNKLSIDDMVDRLDYIANNEHVTIHKDALCEIAKIADGGMRDAINLLDQLISYKIDNIELDDVYKICEIVSVDEIVEFLKYISLSSNDKLIEIIDSINNKGFNLNKFLEEIIYFLKDVLIYRYNESEISSDNKKDKMKLILSLFNEQQISDLIINFNLILNSLKSTNYPSIILIVEVLKLSVKYHTDDSIVVDYQNIECNIALDNVKKMTKQNMVKSHIEKEVKKKEKKSGLTENLKLVRINNTFATASKSSLLELKNQWKKISDYIIDDEYGSIAGLVNDTVPVVVGNGYLIIVSQFESIVERINNDYILIEKMLKKIYDSNFKIVALNEYQWKKEKIEYVNNIKVNKTYSIIRENFDEIKKDNSEINDLINIVGEEIIEYN